MVYKITASKLKARDTKALENIDAENNEAAMAVRGDKCVVPPIELYNHLGECGLEVALIESKKIPETENSLKILLVSI